MEDHLCGVFGWENCAASVLLPRGRGSRRLNVNEEVISFIIYFCFLFLIIILTNKKIYRTSFAP